MQPGASDGSVPAAAMSEGIEPTVFCLLAQSIVGSKHGVSIDGPRKNTIVSVYPIGEPDRRASFNLNEGVSTSDEHNAARIYRALRNAKKAVPA
jgi:hypothetical protein